MLKIFALACAIAAATGLPAFAQDTCAEPIPPSPINGATASEKQLNEATQDVKTFLKQSSDYQDCVIGDLKAKKVQAQHDKKDLDPSVADAARAKIDANQKMKEKVGAEINTADLQFCQAHPTVSGCDKLLKSH